MSFRAFISADIVPSDELASALRELSGTRADLKIVRPELLHVTLKFLGDTSDGLKDEIMSKMGLAAKGVAPFIVRLKGMGAFPSMSNIRVVWVGIEDGKMLEEIARRLDSSVSELGFIRDKRGFVPHLTLARARSGKGMGNVQEMLRRNPATDYGTYTIDRILLKKSVLSPQGPAYSTVAEVPFERPEGAH